MLGTVGKVIGRAYCLLLSGCGAAAALMLAFVAGAVTLDVLLRMYGQSLIWVFEISELLLLWVTMLSLPWIAAQRGHIAVDALVSQLPPEAAQKLAIVTNLVVALLCFMIAYTGCVSTMAVWLSGAENSGMVRYPVWVSRIAVPFGFSLGAIEFFRLAMRGLQARRAK